MNNRDTPILREANKNHKNHSLKLEDMDVNAGTFALRYVKGYGGDPLIELYLDDDESYHWIATFSPYWLESFIKGLEHAKKAFKLKGGRRFL